MEITTNAKSDENPLDSILGGNKDENKEIEETKKENIENFRRWKKNNWKYYIRNR